MKKNKPQVNYFAFFHSVMTNQMRSSQMIRWPPAQVPITTEFNRLSLHLRYRNTVELLWIPNYAGMYISARPVAFNRIDLTGSQLLWLLLQITKSTYSSLTSPRVKLWIRNCGVWHHTATYIRYEATQTHCVCFYAARKSFPCFCDGNLFASEIHWVSRRKTSKHHRSMIFINQTVCDLCFVSNTINLSEWSNFVCRWLWIIIEILISTRLIRTAAQ